ncbi:hypothetical protein CU044_0293 [Streptomyces sp. L-9-10]|nr:hypothetical protein CU044_0293 [Streptomyces sp. L-9-10]
MFGHDRPPSGLGRTLFSDDLILSGRGRPLLCRGRALGAGPSGSVAVARVAVHHRLPLLTPRR